jgi:hypothetical protein
MFAGQGGAAGGASPAPRPSYSSGYQAATAPQHSAAAEAEEEEEPKGPSLFERFKETKAYDKLTDELSSIGERVVDELSRTAQSVIVPLLLNKIKGLIGVDLSAQREIAQRSRLEQQTASTSAGVPGSSGASASAPSGTGGGQSQSTAGGSASSSAATAGGTERFGAP